MEADSINVEKYLKELAVVTVDLTKACRKCFLAVLNMIFIFFLGPGGPGGGSGLPFSSGNHRFWADSGPNPKIFNFYFGPKPS